MPFVIDDLFEETQKAYRKITVEKYDDILVLATKVNSLALTILSKLRVQINDKKKIILISFYHKIIESFQSTIILCTKGLYSDARSISRVLMEAYFKFYAINNDDKYYNYYLEQQKYEEIKQQKNLIAAKRYLTDSQKKSVEEYVIPVTGKKKKSEYDNRRIAKLAKLEGLYNTAYSDLCNSVHSNTSEIINKPKFIDNKIVLTTGNEFDIELLLITNTSLLADLMNKMNSDERLDFKSEILKYQEESKTHQDMFMKKYDLL
ncbi:MAG: hypothetical protein KAQ68_08860 [Clostridiales bacterium]|nr:hypothetical protein [Clostridiales bacterium]